MLNELKKQLEKKDIFKNILGQQDVKLQLQSSILADRNVIIVGPPGVGKTTLAKELASLTKQRKFIRVQGSPDLTVEDLFGDIDPTIALKHGPTSKEAFTPGKIFKADKGIFFFDELNRSPEKLQNTLLQVLQERKVTLGTYDVDFDIDFLFIATMNPQDTNTEKLSDVLLDRFDLIYMDYPESLDIEIKIIKKFGKQITKVPDNLTKLMTYFVRLLRENPDLDKKPSVRASLGLYERVQTNSKLKQREPSIEDFYDVMDSVLAHRISLKPSVKYLKSEQDLLKEELNKFAKSSAAKELESEVP